MAWRQLWASAALVAALVTPLAPFAATPVAAAPPDAAQEATTESDSSAATSDSGTDSGTDAGSPTSMPEDPSAPGAGAEVRLAEIDARRAWTGADTGSIRPRGLEAPVELKQEDGQGAEHRQKVQEDNDKAAKSEDEKRDPGDGPVEKREQKSQERDRAPRDIRVWPMPAESYTFTQQFGCVPQLGNLYFPGEGCPAEAPVIHTGIDLAAPEGTLFYAAASGWVTLAGFDRPTADANTRIIIQHDGRNEHYATDYLHWIASYVEDGDYVRAGDPIGEVGSVGFSTGPHLHFSVTDLETGEHVDPLRWLPDEPGLEGYVSRRPNAHLRLPAGTTAGQPESADPAPPPPPVREDVPDDPPGDRGGRRDRSERRGEGKRDERHAEKRDDSAGKNSDRSGKKRTGADSETTADSDQSAEEKKKDRDRSRERERTRERNKNGSEAEESASGDDGRTRDNPDDSSNEDRRRNRDTGNDSGDGGKQNRGDESAERDNGGRGESGRRNERGEDDTSGRDTGEDGGKDRDKNARTGDDATAGDRTTGDDSSRDEGRKRDIRASGDEADAGGD